MLLEGSKGLYWAGIRIDPPIIVSCQQGNSGSPRLQIHAPLLFDELAALENHFGPCSHTQLEEDSSQV